MKSLNTFFSIIFMMLCITNLNAQAPFDWNATPNLFHYSSNTYSGQGVLKIVTASDGSIIVAGAYTDSALYDPNTNPVAGRVIVKKYSSTGTVLNQYFDVDANWVQVSGLYPTGLNDYVMDMIIDASDNVYLIVTQSDTVRFGGILYKGIRGVIKLDANMNLIWKKLSPADNWLSMIFDSEGNIIVNGTTKNNGDGTLSNIVTMQYSPAGDSLWQKVFSSAGSFYDYGNDVTADGHGNIYVTGSVGSTALGSSAITLKYDADGNLMWNQTYDQSPSGALSDQGTSMVAASNGDVYVEVMSDQGTGYNGTAVLKYDANGTLQWNKLFKTNRHYTQLYPVKIRLDASENVYVGCLLYRFHIGSIYSDFDRSAVMYKLKKSGHKQWTLMRDTAILNDFDVTPAGDVYIAGSYGTSAQAFAAKYNTDAALQWQDVYLPSIVDGQIFTTSTSTCLSINPNHTNEVTTGGEAIVQNSSHIYFTCGLVRHYGGTLKLDNGNLNHNDNAVSIQAFPNPASKEITFGFSLNEPSQVSLQMFNLNGKLQLEKPEQSFEAGAQQFELNTADLVSGIYFCSLNVRGLNHSSVYAIKIIVQH